MALPSRLTAEDGYAAFLAELKDRIRTARLRAALSVNQELILLYWSIGRDILERQAAQGWGARIIDRLAQDLRRDLPDTTGFSARNLKYMRAFAEAYPDREFVQQVVAQLPWGHNVRLIETTKTFAEREWYARQAVEHGWSRAILVHQIDSRLYGRQGKAQTNFARTLPAPLSELAQQVIKDPYNFDFLSLGAEQGERELERSLLEHIRALILELGKGFAFVGNQYHLAVGDQDFYVDLLFYHLRLRCFVVIDFKIEEFKPEHAGKMNFYLSAIDDQLRHDTDKPSIGIILCQRRNEVVVEYALRDTAKPMGVAQYRTSEALPAQLQDALPTLADLTREFPLMAVIKLRTDIERELRRLLTATGQPAVALGVGTGLVELRRRGLAPASTAGFEEALAAMNGAAHGLDLDGDDIRDAVAIGEAFLAELKALRTGDPG